MTSLTRIVLVTSVSASLLVGADSTACQFAVTRSVQLVINQRDLALKETGAARDRALENTVRQIQQGLVSGEMAAACFSGAGDESSRADIDKKIRSFLEAQRIDKQVGAGSTASGSTSAASSGSAPALLGLAFESGAVTKTISGNTVTYRTSPAKLVSALAKQYGQTVPKDDPGLKFLKKINTAVVFNTGASGSSASTTATTPATASTPAPSVASTATTTLVAQFKQVSEFSGRFEIRNNRDLLSKAAYKPIDDLRKEYLDQLAARAGTFLDALGMAIERGDEASKVAGDKDKLAVLTEEELKAAYAKYFQQFRPKVPQTPEFQKALQAYVDFWGEFKAKERETYNKIAKSQIWTLEYAWNRPPTITAQTTGDAATTGSSATTSTTPATGTAITTLAPNHHTLRLIHENRFIGASEYTFNASATWFAEARPTMRGNWRDLQVSGKLDIPLKDFLGAKPTITFSGLYMHLHQPPLGIDLKVNDVKVNKPGDLGLFQAKYSIPVGDSGVSIPIALTVSNRTELIKEKEVRGNIGMTFDLDKLLAKTQK